jgi:transcriptional regulator with XRE-family HTH domain
MAIEKALLGKAIRHVRELRGMSQAALAEAAGLRGNSVALIERGQRGVSMDTLNELADALRVPAACLTMLGTSQIAGQRESVPFVTSLQKLILATIVAQARLEAEEEGGQKQSQVTLRSIPEIDALVRKISGKKSVTRRKSASHRKPKKKLKSA